MFCWLVEYADSLPCPIYATWGPWPTCNPWEAIYFASQDEAEAWMKEHGFAPPWKAIQHGFEDNA
jgi:hypothetical protein